MHSIKNTFRFLQNEEIFLRDKGHNPGRIWAQNIIPLSPHDSIICIPYSHLPFQRKGHIRIALQVFSLRKNSALNLF
jgi:hypothetical protein